MAAEIPGERPLPSSSLLMRQQTNERQSEDMIPLNAYNVQNGHRLNTDNQTKLFSRHRPAMPRLNSAPELKCRELPPIHRTIQTLTEKPSRPLTPLVSSSGKTSLSASKNLPKSCRINLDLAPLVEVGNCGIKVPIERKRMTSAGSDLAQSNDSNFSSNSPRTRSVCTSSRPEFIVIANEASSPKSTAGSEPLDVSEDDTPLDGDDKERMILRWLQTVDRNETVIGDLLPRIKEGRRS